MLNHKRLGSFFTLLGFGTALLMSACSSNNSGPAGGNDSGLPAPPAAPSGLVITVASKSSISMAWTASTSADVTSYTVERAAVGAGTFASVVTGIAANATSYADSSIDQYVAYT